MAERAPSIMSLNLIEQTYRALVAGGKPILKLYSGNPAEQGIHFPAEILKKDYSEYFDTQEYAPQTKGLVAARQAVAAYYARHGVRVDPDHILLTSGTSESFSYLFSLLGKPGDRFLVPRPSYPLFDHIAEL